MYILYGIESPLHEMLLKIIIAGPVINGESTFVNGLQCVKCGAMDNRAVNAWEIIKEQLIVRYLEICNKYLINPCHCTALYTIFTCVK